MLLSQYKSDFIANLRLALPVMLSQLGQISVNQADTIMLGQLGAENLAAVSLGGSIFILIMIFGMGIAMAITPLVAEADGNNNPKEAGIVFNHSMLLNTSISLVLMALSLLLIPNLGLLDQPEEVIQLTKPYLIISTYSFVPFMLFYSLKQYSDGFSLTKYGMYATLIGNVINIAFNYLLIYGKFGFPALGIEGAAWGTFISRVVMMLIMVIILFKSSKLLDPIKMAGKLVLYKEKFMAILKLGIPSALQHLFEIGAFSVAAIIAGWVSTTSLAAHHIALSLATVTFLTCQGFAVSATVRVGNQLGKKDFVALRRAGFSALIQVLMFMFVCGVTFIIFRHSLPYIYVDDEEVIAIASTLLIVASLFQLSDGGQVVMLGALRGLQDVKIPTIITFIAYWVVALPGSYLLAVVFDMGAIGIWISLGLGLSISALFLAIRFNVLSKKLQNA